MENSRVPFFSAETGMALWVLGLTRCSLCDELVSECDRCLSTDHFIVDKGDPMWRYSDSVMHQNCFRRWKHKYEFVEKHMECVVPPWLFRFRAAYLWLVVCLWCL